jgi:hypothetical protein
MAAPDPESYSLLSKVLAAGAGIVAPVWVARNWLENRFGKKLNKDDFKEFLERFDQHARDDREVQAKLFDKIDGLKDTIIERLPK